MYNYQNLYKPNCFALSRYEDYYQIRRPASHLNSCILCYWVLQSAPKKYGNDIFPLQSILIIPDGCIDIVFIIDKKTREYFSIIIGPKDNAYTEYFDYNRYHYFGISFYPGGLYQFLRCSMDEFRNQTYKLEDVMYDLWKELGYKISLLNSLSEMANITDRYLSSLLVNPSGKDALNNILHNVFKSQGIISIRELSKSEVISERQINRIFHDWVGMNPKTLSRIVRFQSMMKTIVPGSNNDLLSIALGNGYYDEAHFCNEFKEFSGMTPGEYIKNLS